MVDSPARTRGARRDLRARGRRILAPHDAGGCDPGSLGYAGDRLHRLPGPDATGVGWVYQYALEGPGYAPDRLRSIQDFQVRYALQSVPGVAEVASLGGYVRQYQVLLDPARLLAYGVTAREVIAAVRGANQDVGARTVEVAGSDYAIRG